MDSISRELTTPDASEWRSRRFVEPVSAQANFVVREAKEKMSADKLLFTGSLSLIQTRLLTPDCHKRVTDLPETDVWVVAIRAASVKSFAAGP